MNYGDGQTQGYSFDAMGNRTQKQDSASGTENYSYNAANMLLSRAGNSYVNDVNGNTITGGGRTNNWDSENRMVSCVNGSNNSSFTYGSDGLRRRSTVNTVSTDFVLDNSMFIRERRNSINIATYLVGARGPEYRRDDTSGSVTSSRKYDVYGLVRGGNNPGGTSSHKFVGKFGHPSEDNTGLIYMRARYYDPAVGRFTSEDLNLQGHNWLNYCKNNPVNCLDSDGKNWVWDVVIAGIFFLLAFCLAATLPFWAGVCCLIGVIAMIFALVEGLHHGEEGGKKIEKNYNLPDAEGDLLKKLQKEEGKLNSAVIDLKGGSFYERIAGWQIEQFIGILLINTP